MTTETKEVSRREGIEELEDKAEQVASEVDELASQLRDAQGQIARAQARFAQLEEERKRLAPRTFQGDSKAKLELEALENEHDEVARNVRVAEAARPELERMLQEAKERLAHARREVLKARAATIRQEMESFNPERDRLADELRKILEQQTSLRDEYIQAVNQYDQDRANALVVDRGGPHAKWVRKMFSRWLR